jgi:transposase
MTKSRALACYGRCGIQGLTTLVKTVLDQAPYSGQVSVLRGKRGDLIKLLW